MKLKIFLVPSSTAQCITLASPQHLTPLLVCRIFLSFGPQYFLELLGLCLEVFNTQISNSTSKIITPQTK